MSLRLALWAALAGGLIPIMAVLNARLGRALGDALFAPMVLFVVALTASLIIGLSLRSETINLNALMETNPLNLAGGLIVCFYVLSATLLAPKMGVGNFIMFAVVAQVIVAACIDHFGLFGVMVREINLMRILGLTLLILGLVVSQLSAKS
jgi:transporter family-2 protein